MSRKHFRAIAEAIMDERRAGLDPTALDQLARRIASVLATTNNRFDRGRFLAACGVDH